MVFYYFKAYVIFRQAVFCIEHEIAKNQDCFSGGTTDIAAGNSVVVSYVENEMIVTEKENGIIAATNFYLHDVPFEYEKQGEDRYEILIKTLTGKKAVLRVEEGMDLLQAVSFDKTEPDDEGRIYSTQWSSVYDLKNPTLYMCADQKYDTVYTYSVAE